MSYKVGVILEVQGASRAETDLKKLDASLNKAGGSASSLLSNFGGNVASNLLTAFTSAVTAGGKTLLNYSSNLEQVHIGFERLEGSTTKAAAQIKNLQKFGATTPFTFEGLLPAAQRFEDIGFKGAKLLPVLTDIGNLVAGGVSKPGESLDQRLERVSYAVKNVFDKGRVQAEELNQLAEAGVPALEALSKGLGKSKSETLKLVEQGKVGADVFLQSLQKLSKADFAGAMEKQSKTFSGSWASIQDVVLQTSGTIFEPFFHALRDLTSNTASELQKNEKAVEQWAQRNRTEMVGLIAVMGDVKAQWNDALGAITRGGEMNPLNSLIGLAAAPLQIGDYFGTQFSNSVYERGKEIESLKAVEGSAGLSAAEMKKLAAATELERLQAERAEKANKTLATTLDSLTSQVAFFGDETEVAAAKQQLINQGVTDFNSGTAKTILNFAAILDKLKSAQKEQSEYNSRLKTAAEYMKDVRENADFETKFPNASPLQQFDRWTRQNAEGFKELKFEIEATRRALAHASWMTSFKEFREATKSAFIALDNELAGLQRKFSSSENALFDFAIKVNVVDVNGKPLTENARNFAEIVESALNIIDDTTGKFTQAQKNNAYTELNRYLEGLQSKVGDEFQKTFGDKIETSTEFLESIRKIRKAAEDEKLSQGFKTLDEVLSDLNLTIGGFGAKSELEKFNEWLSDPIITKAIEQRASAIGLSADAYKKLLQQQKEAQMAQATRPRIVGKKGEDNPFASGLFGEIGVSKIQSEAEMIANVYTQLGQTAGAALNSLSQAMGSLVENWVLYGNASGMSARKAIAAALGMAAAQSTVSAIMETAYGIAALTPWGAAIYGPAPFHFKAAALFGMVAGATALAGRAVAGNSFNESGASSGAGASQPDYYTSNPTTSAGVRNFNGSVQTSNRADVQMTNQIAQLSENVGRLSDMITTARPGDVLQRGIDEKRGLISQTATREFKTNATAKKEFQQTLNMS